VRNLGLPPSGSGATHRGFTLLNSVRKQIHEKASGYNGLHARNWTAGCTQCEALLLSEETTYHEKELIRQLDTINEEALEDIF